MAAEIIAVTQQKVASAKARLPCTSVPRSMKREARPRHRRRPSKHTGSLVERIRRQRHRHSVSGRQPGRSRWPDPSRDQEVHQRLRHHRRGLPAVDHRKGIRRGPVGRIDCRDPDVVVAGRLLVERRAGQTDPASAGHERRPPRRLPAEQDRREAHADPRAKRALEELGFPLLKTQIPTREAYKQAMALGQTVLQMNDRGGKLAAAEIRACADEIVAMLP